MTLDESIVRNQLRPSQSAMEAFDRILAAASPPAWQQAEPTPQQVCMHLGFTTMVWDQLKPESIISAAIALAVQQSERPAPAGQAVGMLADVEALLREAYEHWDADREYKVGKILMALIGHNKGYDKRAEAFRAALAASQAERPAVKEDKA